MRRVLRTTGLVVGWVLLAVVVVPLAAALALVVLFGPSYLLGHRALALTGQPWASWLAAIVGLALPWAALGALATMSLRVHERRAERRNESFVERSNPALKPEPAVVARGLGRHAPDSRQVT